MAEQLTTAVSPEPRPGTTYLVTEDLSKIVKDWCEKIKKPCCDDQFILSLITPLCEALQKYCFPDKKVNVVSIARESFADILDRKNSHDAKRRNEFWVSLDSVYPNLGDLEKDGYIISITRFVDKDNYDISRGPRPESEHYSIEQQITACHEAWERSSTHSRRPVVLVDDGTFSGKTIVEILDKLAKKEMYVDNVRLGVANPTAITEIASWQDEKTKHRVQFVGCLKLCPPVLDWVCERDFFPGVPLSGRAVGVGIDSGMILLKATPFDKPVRKPYLLGCGDVVAWANMKKGAVEFTKEALTLSINLWEELEKSWGDRILVSDLEYIPWYAYRSDPDEMKQFFSRRWVDVIREARQNIPG